MHVVLVQVLDKHLKRPFALLGERGRLESGLLAVDQLHQQEFAQIVEVLVWATNGETNNKDNRKLNKYRGATIKTLASIMLIQGHRLCLGGLYLTLMLKYHRQAD